MEGLSPLVWVVGEWLRWVVRLTSCSELAGKRTSLPDNNTIHHQIGLFPSQFGTARTFENT